MGHTDAVGQSPATGVDVTDTASPSVSDYSSQAHAQEARLLGELLRTSRLALLFGQAGSDKTALLEHDLMPLMRRRAADQVAPVAVRETGVVVPLQDRRSRDATRASKCRREIIVYFDDWTGAPLAALHACILRAAAMPSPAQTAPSARLSDTLSALSGRHDATIIILLDRFEQVLKAPADRQGIAEFMNELVEAINDATLPANFLIALDEEARPMLASIRSRIPGFDDFSLKLTGPQGARPVATPAQEPAAPNPFAIRILPVLNEAVTQRDALVTQTSMVAAAEPTRHAGGTPKVKLPPPARAVIKTDDVYAFIEATLARTAAQGEGESRMFGGELVDARRTQPPLASTRRAPGARPAPPAPPRSAPTKSAGGVGSGPRAPTRGVTLDTVFKWVACRLRRNPAA